MPPKETFEEDDDFRFIVRIQNTDLNGKKPVHMALTQIKGIGERIAEVITKKGGFSRTEPIGRISDDELAVLTELVEGVAGTIPEWYKNRRYDYESGDDLHLIGQELELTHREDLNRMKKTKSYKGVRHEANLKVRGQRLRSNGRKGSSMGVSRKR